MTNYTNNLIPKLTSNTSASPIVVSASSYFASSSSYDAFNAFNESLTTAWASNGISTSWLKVDFGNERNIAKYTIIARDSGDGLKGVPKSWTFEGSSDNSNWTILDTKTNITDWSAKVKKEFTFIPPKKFRYFRINITANNGSPDYISIGEMELMEVTYVNKILIQSTLDNTYKKWNTTTSQFETVTTVPPTEQDFIDNGNDKADFDSIPDSAWDEFDGQEIKVIEYIDNPSQEESVTTIETEPFSFYDEMGDSFDVLYYTDDPDKTSAELEIHANYSPLDEIEGDFDVVTWTNGLPEEITNTLTIAEDGDIEGGKTYSVAVDLTKGIKKIDEVE